MKNIILGLLLGVTIMLSFNAITPPTTITIKPAQPKSWVVTYGTPSILQDEITKFSKKGYIVHSLENAHYNSETILVMYKYY